MKDEDSDSQQLFWKMINHVMVKSGYPQADFHGFMADEAQANWRAVRAVFNGGPNNVMEEGRERSCLFHWEQSLNIHTQKYVHKSFQDEHKKLCELWRTSHTKEEAESQCKVIRQWWRAGKVKECDIPAMDTWMSWWAIRIAHWGEHMVRVSMR